MYKTALQHQVYEIWGTPSLYCMWEESFKRKGFKMNMDLFRVLLQAIALVESGANPTEYNFKENAVGMYQIRSCVMRDVNKVRQSKGLSSFSHNDAYDPSKATEIAITYLLYWGGDYEKEYEQPADFFILAAIWNGGPKGYEKKQARDYAMRVYQTAAQLDAASKEEDSP
jgi:hypothetical protein